MLGFGGFTPFFPRVGFFGGILPSYIPFLVANGWGRCSCPSFPVPFPIFTPIAPFVPFPVFTPFTRGFSW